jgi:hypothetical protein
MVQGAVTNNSEWCQLHQLVKGTASACWARWVDRLWHAISQLGATDTRPSHQQLCGGPADTPSTLYHATCWCAGRIAALHEQRPRRRWCFSSDLRGGPVGLCQVLPTKVCKPSPHWLPETGVDWSDTPLATVTGRGSGTPTQHTAQHTIHQLPFINHRLALGAERSCVVLRMVVWC